MDLSDTRYAIYYAPAEDSLLWKLGSAWLGRDAKTGTLLERPNINSQMRLRADEITSAPAHYGFHATLKPPFVLKAGRTAEELRESVSTFAASRRSFPIPSLMVANLGPFIAVLLSEPSPAFQGLADDSVRALDGFRAPPSEEELNGRRKAGLSSRQDELLRHWGYPYVFDQWRFHMTLTGPLEQNERHYVQDALGNLLQPALNEPVRIDSICLFRQEHRARPFQLAERFSFTCEGCAPC